MTPGKPRRPRRRGGLAKQVKSKFTGRDGLTAAGDSDTQEPLFMGATLCPELDLSEPLIDLSMPRLDLSIDPPDLDSLLEPIRLDLEPLKLDLEPIPLPDLSEPEIPAADLLQTLKDEPLRLD